MKILFVCGKHNYGDSRRGIGYEYGNIRPALMALGHEVVFFESWDKTKYDSFADLNRKLLETAAIEKPDAVLLILMNYEVWIDTLKIIREIYGAVVINWAPDDSWKFRESSQFLLPHVDIHCTTYPAAKEMAANTGFTNVRVTQWAANSAFLCPPRPARECGVEVSFVGSRYGTRSRWIKDLLRRGIRVECFGHGWPNGAVSDMQLREIVRNSVITLNFAEPGLFMWRRRTGGSRQIKARIFEVPGLGGFLLTEEADGIFNHYQRDREIAVFEGIDDLVRKVHYYLSNSDKRDAVATAAFERTKASHTYEQRLGFILEEAEHLRDGKKALFRPVSLEAAFRFLDDAVRAHEIHSGMRLLRSALVGGAGLVLGSRRGGRAARKFAYELSWRVAGERTYRASGLPGRLFYRES